ncbi:MAG: aminotransferase class I/II-fold pyridoxal phosphate-dependent enzyme [Enterococcus sp.]
MKKELRLNPRLQKMAISQIRAFDQEISDIPDIIKLTLGEPDFATPELVKEAGIDAIKQNYSHYTGMRGLPELAEAACAFQKEHYGLVYDPATEVLTTVGATEALATTLLAVLEKGDIILAPAPAYPGYEPLITMSGAQLVTIDTEESAFILTPEQLSAAFLKYGSRVKAVLLNYPNNPTGATLNATQIHALAEVIKDYPVFVISDEIYSELTYEGQHASIATYLPEQTIVINGLSKSHAMTGWRIGFIFAPKEITDELVKVHQYLVTSASTISQISAITALTKEKQAGQKMKAAYCTRRDYLIERLTELGFTPISPKGAFYLFCKYPDAEKLTSVAFCLSLARQAKVACIPGSAFGPSGEGYIRISYASSLEELAEACSRIEAFLASKNAFEESARPSEHI